MPPGLDLARMRTERRARLVACMDAAGVDSLLLFDRRNVEYATGVAGGADEPERARLLGPVALVPRRGDPHLFTAEPGAAASLVPADHVHNPEAWWTADGAGRLIDSVTELIGGDGRAGLAVDEMPVAAMDRLEGMADGAAVVAAARRRKTADELTCLDLAQRLGEAAQASVFASSHGGVSESELNRRFVEAALGAGADAVLFEPAWHPARLGPLFPGVGGDRVVGAGEVIWTDSGVDVCGLAADVGGTWLVDGDAAARSRLDADRRRWWEVAEAILEVVRSGATGAALVAAATRAAGGEPPWLPHLYVVHGLGQHSAEPPLLGTAGGAAADAAVVVEEDEVLVLEPVVGMWREEIVVAVTATGWRRLGVETGDA